MANLGSELLAQRFTWVDYFVFISMLAVSACIGLYYGCVGKGVKSTKDYLMAGKSMHPIPVGMSLIASFQSAVLFLGVPAEIYQSGFKFACWLITIIIAIPAAGYVTIPVFWKLQLPSTFEYLELRFGKPVRILASIFFILVSNVYIAITLYGPALALAQVTGVQIYISIILTSLTAIFYTALGGMKAVLWADVLQLSVLVGSLFLIVLKGTLDLGGFGRVWEVSSLGNRTSNMLDFSLDPRVRHSFWGVTVGHLWFWFSIYGVNQMTVQRYLCVSNLKSVRRLIWGTTLGFLAIASLACFLGLVIYTNFVQCDPVKSGVVSSSDQIVPLFVMDHFGRWKGFPGLFMAGVFSASLSSVSSGINSLTAITLEDYVKMFKPNISEKQATICSKFLSLGYGFVLFFTIFVASKLGNILTATLSITGTIHGVILAFFVLGMFFPNANSKGAFVGTIGGLAFSSWIVIGQHVAKSRREITSGKLPLNACSNFTATSDISSAEILESFELYQQEAETLAPNLEPSYIRELYKISYIWFPLISFGSSMILGLIISILTKGSTVRPDKKLLSPLIHRFCSPVEPGEEKRIENQFEEPNAIQSSFTRL